MAVDGRLFVQYLSPSEVILVIKNVTIEDAGKYICRGASEIKSFDVNINSKK